MKKIILSSLIALVIINSCSSKIEYAVYNESQKFDSIYLYKDFDLTKLKGISKLKNDSLTYPFTRVGFRENKMFLKAVYDEKKNNEISFFKLQDKWCNHSWRYSDGSQVHTLLICLDTAMIELEYLSNPLENSSNKSSSLFEISKKIMIKDTLHTDVYQRFFNKEFIGIPNFSDLNFREYEKECDGIFISKSFKEKDNLTTAYKSIYDKDLNNGSGLPNDWAWSKDKLNHYSLFYFYFENMKDGSANEGIYKKLELIDKILNK